MYIYRLTYKQPHGEMGFPAPSRPIRLMDRKSYESFEKALIRTKKCSRCS
jgi:hypothetical protein